MWNKFPNVVLNVKALRTNLNNYDWLEKHNVFWNMLGVLRKVRAS